MEITRKSYKETLTHERESFVAKCQLCTNKTEEFNKHVDIENIEWPNDRSHEVTSVIKKDDIKFIYSDGTADRKVTYFIICDTCFDNKVVQAIESLGCKAQVSESNKIELMGL